MIMTRRDCREIYIDNQLRSATHNMKVLHAHRFGSKEFFEAVSDFERWKAISDSHNVWMK